MKFVHAPAVHRIHNLPKGLDIIKSVLPTYCNGDWCQMWKWTGAISIRPDKKKTKQIIILVKFKS